MSQQLTFADSEFSSKRRQTCKEDALYEITSMRQFAHLSLDKAIPDRATIMNFLFLLEHKLYHKILSTLNQLLAECGVVMTLGTLVDGTIIQAPAPPNTKQRQQQRQSHA